MTASPKPKGPWVHRLSIRLFTVVLAILIYWALGFLVEDIRSIPGPVYDEVAKPYTDPDVVARRDQLAEEIAGLDRAIADKRDEMRIASDSSQNLQNTINQLIELQRLAIQESGAAAQAEPESLSESLAHFLESQKQYQALNAEISALAASKRTLEAEMRVVDRQLQEVRETVDKVFRSLRDRHAMRLAAIQLLILIPFLAVAAYLVARKRGSIYFPLLLGFGAAVLLKVSLVIHAYFPSRYFKYVLVLGLLVVVVKILVHFIRVVAFPKAQWLTRQYREAYERFLCPVCEYPIRTGPRRYLFWTRRTVNRLVLPQAAPEEKPYACPACGTVLFEECAACHGIRHALLPHCEHCNAGKPVADLPERGDRER